MKHQLVRTLLLNSSISKFISIEETNSSILRLSFSQLTFDLIKQGWAISWSNISANVLNECKIEVNVDKVDEESENLIISVDSFEKPEKANILICALIQCIEEFVYNDVKVSSHFRYKKVLLTGSAGWLGQFVARKLLTLDIETIVYGAYNTQIPYWLIPSRRVHFDLMSEESVRLALTTIKPDIIIHLAAISSPMKCHQCPDLAYQINSPQILISLVQDICPDCLFIFASTDMVYDGESPPYNVTDCFSNNKVSNSESDENSDRPKPVNIYGESKLKCEELVSTQLKNSVVFRLSNMIGAPYVYHFCGEKFLQFLFDSFNKTPRSYIGLKMNEIRSFVYVEDVVDIMVYLILNYLHKPSDSANNRSNIILNIGGPVGLSRLQLADILATSQGSSLDIHDDKKSDEELLTISAFNSKSWPVYIQDSQPLSAMTSNNKDTVDIISSSQSHQPLKKSKQEMEFRSPRDITMNITETENYINNLLHSLPKIINQHAFINNKLRDSNTSINTAGEPTNRFKFTNVENCINDCLHVNI